MAKRTISLNARLKWPDVEDDYVVWQDEDAIGRIRSRGVPLEGWEWFITVPMQLAEWANGTAENRDACMKAFSSAWGRVLRETSPDRLERALDLQRAAEARAPGRQPSIA